MTTTANTTTTVTPYFVGSTGAYGPNVPTTTEEAQAFIRTWAMGPRWGFHDSYTALRRVANLDHEQAERVCLLIHPYWSAMAEGYNSGRRSASPEDWEEVLGILRDAPGISTTPYQGATGCSG